MAKRYAFICPKCGEKIRVTSSRPQKRYCHCDKCNITYVIQRPTNKIITTIRRMEEN